MNCPLFVELCAGTAALSLRLHHPRARPPVSRMGAKTGYADVILRTLGLRPGQGRSDGTRYMWAEPCPGVRLLLEAYRDRDLALAATEIIRGWKDENPKELWVRLRAEGPPKGPEVDPREVARWSLVSGWSAGGNVDGYWAGPDRGGPCGKHPEGWTGSITRDGMASRYTGAPTLPATITDDARDIDPREVARWALSRIWGNGGEPGVNQGWNGGYSGPGDGRDRSPVTIGRASNRMRDAPTLPATITDDARKVDPPSLPDGSVAFIDPPYVGTTGYAHDLGRVEVLEIARKWEAAGAVVCISEAEPIGALVHEGWHAIEITGERRGQKRTFSKQQREWVTMSKPPAWRPSIQGRLFGGTDE